MQAVICRVILATSSLTCGSTVQEQGASSVLSRSMNSMPIPGVGEPFVVLETDPLWGMTLQAADPIQISELKIRRQRH